MTREQIKAASAARINTRLDRLDAARADLCKALIAEGRGSETASETCRKTDALSLRWVAVTNEAGDLRFEVERRAGPAMTRLPRGRGYGPLGAGL